MFLIDMFLIKKTCMKLHTSYIRTSIAKLARRQRGLLPAQGVPQRKAESTINGNRRKDLKAKFS